MPRAAKALVCRTRSREQIRAVGGRALLRWGERAPRIGAEWHFASQLRFAALLTASHNKTLICVCGTAILGLRESLGNDGMRGPAAPNRCGPPTAREAGCQSASLGTATHHLGTLQRRARAIAPRRRRNGYASCARQDANGGPGVTPCPTTSLHASPQSASPPRRRPAHAHACAPRRPRSRRARFAARRYRPHLPRADAAAPSPADQDRAQ